MQVSNIKINGMYNPVGYLMEQISCSWKVIQADAKRQKNVKIEAALDEAFQQIILSKEGENLCQAGEKLELTIAPHTRYFVRVTVNTELEETATSETAFFETAKENEGWTGKWITTKETDEFHPVFCKTFSAEKEITSARLYISGLGLFTARLNGRKIGGEVLAPYYSNYHDEIQYLTFDITDQIERENEIQVELGNGWYKGRFGLGGQKENFGSHFQMIAEIHLTCQDGTTQVIGTDETWKYKGSNTEASDIYDGEIQNDLLWENQENELQDAVLTQAEGTLVERYSLPVQEMEKLSVKEVIHTPIGETVLDFGQNFAGYVSFVSNQPKGTKIVLDFGEILQNDNFYNENYRSAKAQFVYISDGTERVVKPQFT